MSNVVVLTKNDQKWLPNGRFQHKDFFRKRTTGTQIKSHQFAYSTMLFVDWLDALMCAVFGEVAQSYVNDTVRMEGDSSYSPTSQHAYKNATAADINWHDQALEQRIIAIIDYDIKTKGFIYQKMQSFGINGVGTYRNYGEGNYNFCHFDSRTSGFTHYQTLPASFMPTAKGYYEQFLQLIEKNTKAKQLIGSDISASSADKPLPTNEANAGDTEDPIPLPLRIAYYAVRVGLCIVLLLLGYYIFKNTNNNNYDEFRKN